MHPDGDKLLIRGYKVSDSEGHWSQCLVCAGYYDENLNVIDLAARPEGGWFNATQPGALNMTIRLKPDGGATVTPTVDSKPISKERALDLLGYGLCPSCKAGRCDRHQYDYMDRRGRVRLCRCRCIGREDN
jgi:hypothetical protein